MPSSRDEDFSNEVPRDIVFDCLADVRVAPADDDAAVEADAGPHLAFFFSALAQIISSSVGEALRARLDRIQARPPPHILSSGTVWRGEGPPSSPFAVFFDGGDAAATEEAEPRLLDVLLRPPAAAAAFALVLTRALLELLEALARAPAGPALFDAADLDDAAGPALFDAAGFFSAYFSAIG